MGNYRAFHCPGWLHFIKRVWHGLQGEKTFVCRRCGDNVVVGFE
jgi:hypothetical protein